MSDEKAPADDLRSILSASFDDAMSSTAISDGVVKPTAADVSASDPSIAKPDGTATDVDAKSADARDRSPDGKFAKKKDGEAEPKSDDKPESKAKETEVKADEPATADKTTEPKTDGKDPPANWSASDKAMFKLQPADAQAFLLRRYKEMESGFTKKSEALAGLQKEYGPIDEMFRPHLDTLKAKGLTPAATIRAWANVETALANGRGIDVISGVIKGYGIDKAALAQALGFTSTGAAQPSTETAHVDPATAGAQPIALPPEPANELQQLRARLDAQDNDKRIQATRTALDREAAVEADINRFKSEANEAGELKHPYYEEVEPAMVALVSSYVASKQPIPPLAELYETAVWANPSTRQAMLASQKAAEQAKAAEEARAKAARARNAGSSVTGSPGSGQATRQIRGEQTLREQLEEAAADLG